jgi:hypothetical protein
MSFFLPLHTSRTDRPKSLLPNLAYSINFVKEGGTLTTLIGRGPKGKLKEVMEDLIYIEKMES